MLFFLMQRLCLKIFAVLSKKGIKTKCFPQEAISDEEFSPSAMIKGVHINFRPDVNILKELRMKKSFRRISSEAME